MTKLLKNMTILLSVKEQQFMNFDAKKARLGFLASLQLPVPSGYLVGTAQLKQQAANNYPAADTKQAGHSPASQNQTHYLQAVLQTARAWKDQCVLCHRTKAAGAYQMSGVQLGKDTPRKQKPRPVS
jgi:hypothetical protein